MWVEHVEFQLSASQAGHTADGHVHAVGAVMGADSEHQQQSCGGAVVVGVYVLYRLAACPRHRHVIQVACNTGNSGLSVHPTSCPCPQTTAVWACISYILSMSSGNSGLSVHPTSWPCPQAIVVWAYITYIMSISSGNSDLSVHLLHPVHILRQ